MIGAVVLQVVLIALNAVFASAEIAVISLNGTKLEKMSEEGDRRARRLASLTENPAKFLATIQVAITLAGFLGSAYAADHFAQPLVKVLVDANRFHQRDFKSHGAGPGSGRRSHRRRDPDDGGGWQ